jgi:hypothetical protein
MERFFLPLEFRGRALQSTCMRRLLLTASAALLGLAALSLAVPVSNAQTNAQKDSSQVIGKEVAPDVPDAIQVPAGEEVVLYTHATGSQIYTCQPAAGDRFTWTLKGPDAELHDRKDKVIGQHSAGPTWKLKDGSEVTGKAAAQVESLDTKSIPWLLVKVTSNAGKGALSEATTIQRVHTKGGKPPAEGCDAAHKDAETKSSYSADYYFYAPVK